MLDLEGKIIEFSVREDGEVVWVNINGICAVRINNPKKILIIDSRPKPPTTARTEESY